jgi:hypothetical protein
MKSSKTPMHHLVELSALPWAHLVNWNMYNICPMYVIYMHSGKFVEYQETVKRN